MPTNSEKQWDKETGGDLTAEQVQRNLTYNSLEDAIALTAKLLDVMKRAEFESHQKINFDSFVYNPFSQTPKGWLRSLRQYLFNIQQDYEVEEP